MKNFIHNWLFASLLVVLISCFALDAKDREAKPDVVIAHVHWKVNNMRHHPHKEAIQGIFTYVLLKTNEVWEIAATQNTLMNGKGASQ